MPRKNKRKDYSISKKAVFSGEPTRTERKPECSGCAFADYGGVCTASEGICLLGSVKTKVGEYTDATR